MRLQFASDRAVFVSWGEAISPEAHRHVLRLFSSLRGRPEILNLHPAYASLLVDFDPLRTPPAEIERTVREAAGALQAMPLPEPRTVEIPVVYGGAYGPDLPEVARLTGLSPDEVVALHSGASYLVNFLGFSPGFPYLDGLPPALAAPRLDTPRTEVPAGSVAIGGSQAGIYPMRSPGGWRIIGRTPARLFDPRQNPPALLRMGDGVRFVREEKWPPTDVNGGPSTNEDSRASAFLRGQISVVSPGLLSTIQDLGRPGYAHLGVSASGAADPLSLRAGNLLVGNHENAPAIEMTLLGGSFRFAAQALVALCGGEFDADIPLWQSHTVRAGQTIRIGGARRGARCYLCVRGGIEVPAVLGSASTHLLTGLGGFEGRALRRGDRLAVGGRVIASPRRLREPPSPRGGTLRITPGPQAGAFDLQQFCGAAWQVSEESNRMGLRLHGPALERREGHMLTEGVPLGAVQVPPGGQPIILFVEHQTTGGYPKIANVIAADLPALGQLRPRDRVRFECVSVERSLALLREQEEWLRALA